MRKNKELPVLWRTLAHKQLDEWIDDVTKEDHTFLGSSKLDPRNLFLGKLAPTMVEAYKEAARLRNKLVEVDGKKYRLSDIKTLREVSND